MTSTRRLPIAIALILAVILSVVWLLSLSRTPESIMVEIADSELQSVLVTVHDVRLLEFAESEIQLTLAELCAAKDAATVNSEQTYDEAMAQIEEQKDILRDVANRLAVSTEAEHLHLAALLETEHSDRIELVKQALLRSPGDAYLVWDAVRICADALDQADCPLSRWEQRLLEIDGQNSESWVLVAKNRYVAGDIDAALEAMQQAATAAETRAYWTESIEMIERGFAAGSDFAFPERAGGAMGIAASKQPDYAAYYNMCKEQSLISTEWAYVCLAYGELSEKQGKTGLGQSIARSIQERALEVVGYEEKLAAVLKRQQETRRKRSASTRSYNSLTSRIAVSNPAIFSAYLAAVRTHGEVRAQTYLQLETERWLARQTEFDCDF